MPVLFRHYFCDGSAFVKFPDFVQAERFRTFSFQYSMGVETLLRLRGTYPKYRCFTALRSWTFQLSGLVIRLAAAPMCATSGPLCCIHLLHAAQICSLLGCPIEFRHFLLIIAKRYELPDGIIIYVVVEGFHWLISHIEKRTYELHVACVMVYNIVVTPSVACCSR